MGAGRVDVDRVYKNITEKYKFGNFDTHDLFVDPSYTPSVQAMQFVLVRTMNTLQAKGDNERAGELARLYFEAFPHMNFKFDYNSLYPIQVLVATGNNEEAKVHIETLATSVAEWQDFYATQDASLLEQGKPLGQDANQARGTIGAVQQAAASLRDPAFTAKINALLGLGTQNTTVPSGQDPS